MAQNYTRQSSFADGDTITAALFNNEFNQVVNAFSYSASSDSSTGHKHDGTAGQGGNIPQIGDIDFLNKIVVDNTNNRWGFYVQVSSGTVEQLRIQDGAIVPVTNNDIDLGTSSLEFKDLFIDGTAHIDTLDVDVNATVAGTLGVTGATTLSSTLGVTGATTLSSTLGVTGATTLSSTLGVTGAITGSSTLQATTITATTAFVPDASDGASLGTVSLEFSDLFLADGALIAFGNDQDVTITHLADAGLLLNGARGLFFNDTTQYINAPNGTTLDIAATDEIELNATLIDINGAVDISGNLDVGGNLVVTGTTTFNGGTLTMGDAATDNVVFNADINSNIIPNTDDTYDLGSSSQEWRNLYIDGTANIDSLVADTADINGGTIDGATIGGSSAGDITYANLSDGTITITAFADEDDMSSDSATLVPTQQSVKAYVDSQVGTVDTLSEILANGNTTGSTDIAVDSAQKVQFRDAAIYLNSSVDGQLDIVADTEIQIAATTVDLNGNLDVSGTALVAGVLTTTAATVFNGGFASNADSTLGTDKKVQFRDSAIYINSSADGQLDIVADTEIQIAATTVDLNGNLDVSGTTVAGAATFSGDVNIDKASPILIFKESAAAKLFIGESSAVGGGAGYYDFYAVTGLGQRFFTNSVERLRINSVGVLQSNGYSVVASSARAASGTLRLGNIESTSMLLDYDDQGQTIATVRNQYGTTDATAELSLDSGFITFNTGTSFTEVMRINADRKVDVGAVANQTAAVLNARFNGAAIEFGHGNNTAGYYGTAGSYGNNGQPYIGFSCDAEESVNTFTTRGAKGNIITGDLSGNLTFAQVTTATGTGLSPTNRMMLDASGNLGLGVVPSAWSVAVPALQLGICGAFLCAQGATEALYLGSNAYYNGTNWIYAVNAPATYYRENGGVHAWFNAPSGTTGDPITFTQAMTLDASGKLGVGLSSPTGSLHTTVKDSDGSDVFVVAQNTTSNRIAGFKVLDESGTASLVMQYDNGGNSATISNPNNGSLGIYLGGTGAANLLDDYEEGTWTPTITNSTGSYTTQVGRYTKIGNLVYVNCNVNTAFTNTGTTSQDIGGLPFTCENVGSLFSVGTVFPVVGFNQGNSDIAAQVTINTTSVALYTVAPTTGINYTRIVSNTFGTTVEFEFSLCYRAA
jgi:hypothetical protein